MRKTEKIIDFFKTVLIYLLTLSMLTSAGFYISARQNYGRTAEIPLEKRRIIESGGVIPAEMNENQVNPVQITVTVENDSVTFVYNDMLISKVYGGFKNTISGLFKSSECTVLNKTEGDALWKKCAAKSNSVYIRYAGDYIYPVLCAFLDETQNGSVAQDSAAAANSADSSNTLSYAGNFNGSLAKVRELFIVDENPVYGVAKDSEGNISVFSPGEFLGGYIGTQLLDTKNLQSAYNNSAGGIPCKFLKGGDISSETGINANRIKNLIFPDDFQVFKSYTASSALNFTNPLLDENNTDGINNINKINIDRTYIKSLFSIFNFNAESAGSHSYLTYSVYIDGRSTIKFFTNGQIIYSYAVKPSEIYSNNSDNNSNNANSNGGVHLSKFLGYDAGGGSYTFYEKIKAASIFINGLPAELAGGTESSLYLQSIASDENNNLAVRFDYYYKGSEVKVNGSGCGVYIVMNNDSITDVTINSLNVTSQKTIRNINPVTVLSALDGMISKDINDINEIQDIKDAEKQNTAGKYNITYDKERDKFLVNKIELVYNINYGDSNGGSAEAEWTVK